MLITTCQSLEIPKQVIKKRIVEGFGITESEAEQALAEYWC